MVRHAKLPCFGNNCPNKGKLFLDYELCKTSEGMLCPACMLQYNARKKKENPVEIISEYKKQHDDETNQSISDDEIRELTKRHLSKLTQKHHKTRTHNESKETIDYSNVPKNNDRKWRSDAKSNFIEKQESRAQSPNHTDNISEPPKVDDKYKREVFENKKQVETNKEEEIRQLTKHHISEVREEETKTSTTRDKEVKVNETLVSSAPETITKNRFDSFAKYATLALYSGMAAIIILITILLGNSKLIQRQVRKLRFWMGYRKKRTNFSWNTTLLSLFWLVGIIVLLIILYNNLQKLNTVYVWIFPLGGVLLIISSIFTVKLAYNFLKDVFRWYHGERNIVKYVAAILILVLVWQGYTHRETIFDPITDFYEANSKLSILPIQISEGSTTREVLDKSKTAILSAKESVEQAIEEHNEPTSGYTKEIEAAIVKYTNIERRNHGLSPLQHDTKLDEVARNHSLDMIQNNFFSHENLRGEDPSARARRHRYPLHKELGGGWYSDGIAENIGQMSPGNIVGIGYVSSDADSMAKAHVQAWMDSPGHRANILDAGYDKIGVGVANDYGTTYATQNFW